MSLNTPNPSDLTHNAVILTLSVAEAEDPHAFALVSPSAAKSPADALPASHFLFVIP